ncbi:MAG: hypothetical protein R3E64_13785 [Halioglobus sp.]
MKHRLQNTLLVCLLGSVASFTHSQGNTNAVGTPIVISSGVEGGGYWNAANRLQRVAAGMDLGVENAASVGSINNLRNLVDQSSPVSLAFAQADALQYYLNDHPNATRVIDTLADIGNECVFIISDGKGDIESIDDMAAAPRLHLGIKSASSGMRVTWSYMTSLMPELKHITVTYGNAVEMMTDFAHPLTDIERAVMVVQGPNERSPEIDMVIANPDRYQFVDISAANLTQKTAGGAAVYESMKVKPGAIDHAKAVETICVRGLLLANTQKLDAEQRDTLMALIANHWAEVTAPKE